MTQNAHSRPPTITTEAAYFSGRLLVGPQQEQHDGADDHEEHDDAVAQAGQGEEARRPGPGACPVRSP